MKLLSDLFPKNSLFQWMREGCGESVFPRGTAIFGHRDHSRRFQLPNMRPDLDDLDPFRS